MNKDYGTAFHKNNNLYIMGKDYLNRPVEGGTLKEHLNEN